MILPQLSVFRYNKYINKNYARYYYVKIINRFTNFFLKNQLKVDILEDKTNIKIKLKSKTVRCACPKCNTISDNHHGKLI